jgi:hypothetical protein
MLGPVTTRPDAERIARLLSREESPLRQEGIDLAIEHVLSRNVQALLDVEAARSIALDVLTEENLELIIRRHIRPGWQRYSEAAAGARVPVGAFVPDGARQRIRDTLATTRMPRGKWADGAVDPALFRRLFAPVFAQLLINFAKKLPGIGAAAEATGSSPPPSGREGSGGIAGKLAQQMQKRAERIVDAGRNVMGGIGAEMERRMQATAREFSEGALGMWREALRDRLSSDEGRAIVGQISQQATDHVMVTELGEIQRDAERLPVEQILEIVPAIVAHAASHTFIQKIVERELRAFLEAEGARPLRELLAELGILQPVREAIRIQANAHAQRLFGTDAFTDWLARVLEQARDA